MTPAEFDTALDDNPIFVIIVSDGPTPSLWKSCRDSVPQRPNQALIEAGVPAGCKSLHLQGRAADIHIAQLNSELPGSLMRCFRQGGEGFYYRPSSRGRWIHADAGLQRTWRG